MTEGYCSRTWRPPSSSSPGLRNTEKMCVTTFVSFGACCYPAAVAAPAPEVMGMSSDGLVHLHADPFLQVGPVEVQMLDVNTTMAILRSPEKKTIETGPFLDGSSFLDGTASVSMSPPPLLHLYHRSYRVAMASGRRPNSDGNLGLWWREIGSDEAAMVADGEMARA